MQITFKEKVNLMTITSAIGSPALILFILGMILKKNILIMYPLIVYVLSLLLRGLIWRCPKCKGKLPKGHVSHIKECTYCHHNLQ